MPREDFEFFWIFEELFVFVTNSPVDIAWCITTVELWLPSVFITGESRLTGIEYTGKSILNGLQKKPAGAKNTMESGLPCD
jgi:hypothetical protein